MITKSVFGKWYDLKCDYCKRTVYLDDYAFHNFINAVDFKKKYKWRSICINNKWHDMCRSCILGLKIENKVNIDEKEISLWRNNI